MLIICSMTANGSMVALRYDCKWDQCAFLAYVIALGGNQAPTKWWSMRYVVAQLSLQSCRQLPINLQRCSGSQRASCLWRACKQTAD